MVKAINKSFSNRGSGHLDFDCSINNNIISNFSSRYRGVLVCNLYTIIRNDMIPELRIR